MRHRLYIVEPNLTAAQQAMNDLLLARIDERHIHCLASRGAPMDGLHEANMLQKTDAVHGAEMGLLIGGGIGAVLGLIVVLVPPGGGSLHLITGLLLASGGAYSGSW